MSLSHRHPRQLRKSDSFPSGGCAVVRSVWWEQELVQHRGPSAGTGCQIHYKWLHKWHCTRLVWCISHIACSFLQIYLRIKLLVILQIWTSVLTPKSAGTCWEWALSQSSSLYTSTGKSFCMMGTKPQLLASLVELALVPVWLVSTPAAGSFPLTLAGTWKVRPARETKKHEIFIKTLTYTVSIS